MRGISWAMAFSAMAFSALPVAANDSVAGMHVGGLELTRTDAVAMVSEVLHITPDRVQVRYVYRNETDREIRAIVAFPLPELGRIGDRNYLPLPDPRSDNYVDFTTWVDGVAVDLQVEHRARLDGTDRTADLIAHGVPLVPFDAEIVYRAVRELPVPSQDYMRSEGLADEYGRPNWTLQSTFWREQVFAPGQEVVVEHAYTPVAGMATWTWFPGPADPETVEHAGWHAQRAIDEARYCPTPELEAQARAQLDGETALQGYSTFLGHDVGYILSTGANWRGPIGHFRLVVEANGAWDFVIFCLDGARRISQSRVEFEATDFTPTHDLDIHFAVAHGEAIEAAEAAGLRP